VPKGELVAQEERKRPGPQKGCRNEDKTHREGVFPTLEVVVREIPAHMHKVMCPDVGIPLIDLDWPDS
jgi:hypothetical protein